MDLNKVCLIGNLGKDPEVKAFDNGGKIANFSIATTRKWTSNGEKNEKTEWHNITIRDKNLVEVADKYLQKGTRVYLEGRLETRKYTKDGADRYITEIVLSPFESRLHIEARGRGWRDDGGGDGDSRSNDSGGSGDNSGGDPFDDEIPF